MLAQTPREGKNEILRPTDPGLLVPNRSAIQRLAQPHPAHRGKAAAAVAQVSDLLHSRFPTHFGAASAAARVGRSSEKPNIRNTRMVRRLEALRYSRLETCATTLAGPARILA